MLSKISKVPWIGATFVVVLLSAAHVQVRDHITRLHRVRLNQAPVSPLCRSVTALLGLSLSRSWDSVAIPSKAIRLGGKSGRPALQRRKRINQRAGAGRVSAFH